MNADGTGQVNLTHSPPSDVGPYFSPDGARLLFASDREGGNRDVYVMNLDGTGVARLTTNPAGDGNPSWGGAVQINTGGGGGRGDAGGAGTRGAAGQQHPGQRDEQAGRDRLLDPARQAQATPAAPPPPVTRAETGIKRRGRTAPG